MQNAQMMTTLVLTGSMQNSLADDDDNFIEEFVFISWGDGLYMLKAFFQILKFRLCISCNMYVVFFDKYCLNRLNWYSDKINANALTEWWQQLYWQEQCKMLWRKMKTVVLSCIEKALTGIISNYIDRINTKSSWHIMTTVVLTECTAKCFGRPWQ